VADVLHANDFATLPFCLHTQAEQAAGMAPPGMVLSKRRVGALVDALARQPGLAQPPLAADRRGRCRVGLCGRKCSPAPARTEIAGVDG
jgi:hypothetical protein